MTTMTTIERALLEQALESMCWAARTLNIDPDEAPNYHRSLENIRAALAAPATEPEKCWCDEQGIGEPGVSCGDCPTRDYKAAASAQPAWQDAPTSPGVWLSDRGYENPYRWGIYKVVDPDHEKGMTLEGERWFGPISPDTGNKP